MKLIKNNYQLGAIQLPPVLLDCPNFPLIHGCNIFKKGIYINKGTLRICHFFVKFDYSRGPNILQLVFDFITVVA